MRLTKPLHTSLDADDFRALGLRRGEASAPVIRHCLLRSAQRVSASAGEEDLNGKLTQVVVSGYRVLDPRYRPTLYERVQLCYPLDREEDDPSQVNSAQWNANLDQLSLPNATSELNSVTLEPSKQSRAIVLEDHCQTSIEDARQIVRWIKRSEARQRHTLRKWTRHFRKFFAKRRSSQAS